MWCKELREFVSWYNNEFKFTELYTQMTGIVEDSPYHRESSVAAHTDMVVMTLLGLQTPRNENMRERLIALFAAAFHDVGKPSMREEKFSEERGVYYAYHGHELRSARLWQDFYATHKEMFDTRFNFSSIEFYEVAVMIEKHRPWGTKDMSKISAIYSSIGVESAAEWLHLLQADNIGRITDSQESLQQSLSNIAEYEVLLQSHDTTEYNRHEARYNNFERNKEKWGSGPIPQLIMPIAQTGAGKSTTWERIKDYDEELNPTQADFVIHSMDLLRAERYGDEPEAAFKASVEDSEFTSAVQADFHAKVKNRENIYVDNTNLSAKRRRFYITEAQKHGYVCNAILFPMSIYEAHARNANRTNKAPLGTSVVNNQYMALSMPLLAKEFDKVMFVY